MAETILLCQGVWKLYGPDPKAFFARHDASPDLEIIFSEGYIPAVRGVSLDVQAGEILVIMGLSGSGKSTLVRCLSRLIEPTGGEIFFEGKNLLQATSKEMIDLRRHRMGMVFQNFALLPHRTVLQNVAFPLEVQGIGRAKRDERAREIIALVGLEGREGYYPRELSGGQQQRVGIARSLAVGPEVWFLDEPFSALDPLIRREMQDEFLRLQSMLHKTIVFITHDFDEAIRLADRIAIMRDGAIDQLGTPEEIVTNPATDYVREFTKDVARGKLLTVGSVMREGANGGGDQRVAASSRLSEAAPVILNSENPVNVVDEAGKPVGTITREQIVDALFGSAE
ncbi:MAG: betaine/proline/choline family ABC transporter ATP-binding protein [Rhodovibrionaceae bacterium]|nr:betaine/proline/choline family ABC transporter ATP-binding protein [Rhodovibrionaceae bacterium]